MASEEDVRRIALGLPGPEEGDDGTLAFSVGGKRFAWSWGSESKRRDRAWSGGTCWRSGERRPLHSLNRVHDAEHLAIPVRTKDIDKESHGSDANAVS